jgi:osmotically-inducible protein OsmY
VSPQRWFWSPSSAAARPRRPPAVKAKLTEARFSNILNVETNVTNGIVTLAGEVPNAQVKADAEAAVREVKGVKGVNNNLQVKSPPTP